MLHESGVTQEELTKILTVVNSLSSSNERATVDTISSHLPNEPPTADRLLKILNVAVTKGSIVKSLDGESYQPARSLRPQRRSGIVQAQDTLSELNKSRRGRVPRKNDNLTTCASSSHETRASAPPVNRDMAEIIPICSFCLGDEEANSRKEPEEMIACWGCGRSGHPSCLQMTPSMIQCVKRLRWYCVDCKRCTLCHYSSSNAAHTASIGHLGESPNENKEGHNDLDNSSDKDNDLLLCDTCDRGYHLSCVAPDLSEPPAGTWNCPICERCREVRTPPALASSEAGSAAVQDLGDPRLRAAAVCDVLTDHEIRLIRKALKGAVPARGRPPRSSKTPTTAPKSPVDTSLKPPSVPLKPKKSSTFVQKTLLNWAVKIEEKGKAPNNTKLGSTVVAPSHVVTRRGSLCSNNAPTSDGRTTRSATRLASDALGASSPPAKRPRLSALVSPLRIDIPENSQRSPATGGGNVDALSHSPRGLASGKRPRRCRTCKSPTTVATRPERTGVMRLRRRIGRPSVSSTNYTDDEGEEDTMDTIAADIVDGVGKTSERGGRKPSSKNDSATIFSSPSGRSVDADDEEDTELRSISDADRKLFSDIQVQVQNCLPQSLENSKQLPPANNPRLLNPTASTSSESSCASNHVAPAKDASPVQPRFPPRIQLGKYRITTWYSAPYPSEYARLNLLYICEFCLKYIKTVDVYMRHINKCTSYYPPGNEIYRSQNISVFEVDGYSSKLYCQQLCLLAKLFLDHKTLYYDVEPFLFYVVTVHDQSGYHVVGYFSKEKRSAQKYNLSCIMVLPPYQKQAFGRFLIDFSYLLSRIEGMPGSPEKPLSELGRLSYESYWRSKVLPFIIGDDTSQPTRSEVTIQEISESTGMDVHDVVATLQQLSTGVRLHPEDGRPLFTFDMESLSALKAKYDARAEHWIKLDDECLRWSPLTNQQETDASQEGQSSHLASPRAQPDSLKADLSPSNQLKTPAPKSHSSPVAPAAAASSPQPPKKRRPGRPPRRATLASTAASTKAPPPRNANNNNNNNTNPSSILLDAFPLPALDMVDASAPTPSVDGAQKGDGALLKTASQPTPCKKEGYFLTPQRPPDSPPSGGSVSSGTRNAASLSAFAASSSSTASHVTSPKTSSSGGGRSGRASSRGKGRDCVETGSAGRGLSAPSPPHLKSPVGQPAMAMSTDIQLVSASPSVTLDAIENIVGQSSPLSRPEGVSVPPLTLPSRLLEPIPLTSPVEMARGADLSPVVSNVDFDAQHRSPGEVIFTLDACPVTLAPVSAHEDTGTTKCPLYIASPDLTCSRSYSLPQMQLTSVSSPNSPLSRATDESLEPVIRRHHSSRDVFASEVPSDDLQKSGSLPELSIHTYSDFVDSGLPPARGSFSLDSSSTCPMVTASPSPALSDESVGSEETAPMHYDFLLSALDLARGTQQPLPRQSARRYSMTTQHLELARLVDGPVWEECERLDDVGFTTVKVDPEVVAEEAVWCQAVECQIFTASLVPPTPCSTDSLSSTSPPFVFHAPSGELGVAARVSPAVDFPSLHPCPLSNPPDPLWSNSCAVVPQQTPRPPSPVFPERPVSPIQHATDIQALPAPPIYSYPPVPAPCYCPMCFPGVAWMAACPQFPCCLPPAPATPAFIDPTSGAPVFSCCLPMSTFPTGSTTSTFIPLGPHALPYPASAPSTSQVNSQLPYAIAISPKAGSVMSGQQVPPADSTSNAPNGPGEWVFEANSAASAYPLHG